MTTVVQMSRLRPIRRLVGARWTPYDLPSSKLKAWWHADDHSSLMTDDGSGVISAWLDRVASIKVTAATTARPTWASTSFDNGFAGITFDGSANCFVTTTLTAIPTGAKNIEMWALVSPLSSATANPIISYGGTGSTTNRQLRKDASNRCNVTDGSTSLSFTPTAGTFLGAHILRGLWSGTTMGFRVDGGKGENSTTFANASIGTTRLRIGASNGTSAANFCPMVLRQLFIIEGALTRLEKEELEYYLAFDVQISTLLSSTHPFYFGSGDTAAVAALPAYFTPADSTTAANAGYKVVMQASPPTSDLADETTYAYWPLTDDSSQSIDLIASSTWSGKRWGFLWANRRTTAASHNYKANPIFPAITLNGKQCRAEYSSVAKADAATKVRAMHWLGYTQSEYEAVATAAGFVTSDIVARATLAAAPSTYFTGSSLYGPGTYNVMTDKIWLNDNKLTEAASYEGIILDYEVQDGRSTTEASDFLLDMASTVHAKSKLLFIYTNRLDGSVVSFNGFDETNLPDIYTAVDFFGLLLQAGTDMTASFAAQKALLGL